MDKSEEREFWYEFIDLYKSHPVLWKINSDIYKDREQKKQAYKELVNKLTELIPTADVDMVKRKINSLRACYRREMKKIREHETIVGGGSDDDEYVPMWCYFRSLSFLHGQDYEEPADIKPGIDLGEFEMDGLPVKQRRAKRRRSGPAGRNREEDRERERNGSCDVESVEIPCHPQPQHQLQSPDYSHSLGAEDEADVLGKCWAFQYRSLTDDQRLYAQKAISDIFFEAKLGLLRRDSVKINT